MRRVRRVASDHKHERLDDLAVGFAGIGFELDLRLLVQANAIGELQLFDGLLAHAGGIEVLPRHHGGLLDEAIGDRAAQGVVIDDIVEGYRALRRFDEGRCRQFEPKDRLQLVDGAKSSLGTVAVGLVHQQDEVRQGGEVVEVALADVFREPLDLRCFAAADLRVDLGNVEDIDVARRQTVEPLAGPCWS